MRSRSHIREALLRHRMWHLLFGSDDVLFDYCRSWTIRSFVPYRFAEANDTTRSENTVAQTDTFIGLYKG
jgi:hypothetical protein